MTATANEYDWIDDFLHDLPPAPGLVVFDIDSTLISIAEGWELRPGVHGLFAWMRSVGYRIALWSSNNEWHVREVAHLHQLDSFTCHMSGKPPFPPSVKGSLIVLGERPLLTVDDSLAEAVPGWSFHHISPFGPYEEPLAE